MTQTDLIYGELVRAKAAGVGRGTYLLASIIGAPMASVRRAISTLIAQGYHIQRDRGYYKLL